MLARPAVGTPTQATHRGSTVADLRNRWLESDDSADWSDRTRLAIVNRIQNHLDTDQSTALPVVDVTYQDVLAWLDRVRAVAAISVDASTFA